MQILLIYIISENIFLIRSLFAIIAVYSYNIYIYHKSKSKSVCKIAKNDYRIMRTINLHLEYAKNIRKKNGMILFTSR